MKTIKITTNISNKMPEYEVLEFEGDVYTFLANKFGGSYPEHVRPSSDRLPYEYCFFVDDCGLLKDLAKNKIGSYFYQGDIAGDIFIMKNQPDYEVSGLDDNDVEFLLDKFFR